MKENNHNPDWFLLVQRGDKVAFNQVFELHYRSVLFFASSILKQDSYAEDIVIQTFTKAWDRRASFESPRHLENFLFLVTRNACISYLRAGRVIDNTAKEWDRLTRESSETTTPVDLERVQARLIEKLYEHLMSLLGGEILRMSYLEGKSTREIAEELQITENSVYVKKFRSLKLLRERLQGEDPTLLILFLLLFKL